MTRPVAGNAPGELIDRIRALWPDDELREVRMFGVTAVMVNNTMAVAVGRDGSLLVRVDPAEDAELLTKPGTSRAEMGTGRSMGEGWIRVDADAVREPASLVEWVQAASRFLDGKTGR